MNIERWIQKDWCKVGRINGVTRGYVEKSISPLVAQFTLFVTRCSSSRGADRSQIDARKPYSIQVSLMLLQRAKENGFSKGVCYFNAYLFYFKPQLMYWHFVIIVCIPSETEWVQSTAIHCTCCVGVHTPPSFLLKQLQCMLASTSLQVSGQRLVVWHLKRRKKRDFPLYPLTP